MADMAEWQTIIYTASDKAIVEARRAVDEKAARLRALKRPTKKQREQLALLDDASKGMWQTAPEPFEENGRASW